MRLTDNGNISQVNPSPSYPSGGRVTKEQTRMLSLLTEHKGAWVNARELTPIACAYCRVIRELRAMGHCILNRVVRDGKKTRAGYYMLADARQAAAAKIGAGVALTQADRDAAANDHREPTLFDMSEFGAHRDEG